MRTTSSSRPAWFVAAVAGALLLATLLPQATLADCTRSSPPPRAKSSSDLRLEGLLLKHRPYLVIQQPNPRRDGRQ